MMEEDDDCIASIKNSDLPDDVKVMMIWYADRELKPWNVSIREKGNSYPLDPEIIWNVEPLNDGVSSFVSMHFAEDIIYIEFERLWMGHMEYMEGRVCELEYVDPKHTPEHVWSVIKAKIDVEDKFLRTVEDRE